MSPTKFARHVLQLSLTRPLVPIALFFIVGALASWRATRLSIRPELWTLLSPEQPSVVEIKRTLERTRGLSNLFVVLEGSDQAQLRRFGDALVPELVALGRPWVGSAESGLQELRAFLAPRAGLFATPAELRQLLADLHAEEQRQFRRLIGADLGDDDQTTRAPGSPLSAARLERLLGSRAEYAARYPDGYYQNAAGTALVVVARSAVLPDDLSRSRRTVQAVTEVVERVHVRAGFADVRVSYAGDLVTGLAEYSAIRHDLLEVGVLGVVLVLAVALLFYRRVRALLLMGITIATGVALTFGLTELVIGSLNIATGFLFSIVAGNGINAGIILQSRYFEERQRHGPRVAVDIAARDTALPTLAASLAAAVAYLALAATDFQAFRQFAFIGCAGMVLCWVTTYGLLPALLIASDRMWPLRPRSGEGDHPGAPVGSGFAVPFVQLVARAPRPITVAGIVLGLGGGILTVRYIVADPLEYNLRHMENDRTETGALYRASALAAEILGARTEGAMIVMADRLDQVAPLQAALRAARDAAPPDQKPFEEVHGLLDFVPPDQDAKLPLLAQLRRRLLRAHDRGSIDAGDWERLLPYLPPADLRPFGAADLPATVRAPFTERDGSTGRILFIEPTAGRSDSDLRYLLAWADSFRQTRLPGGEIIHGSGRAVIYADLVGAVVRNMPLALTLALLATLASVAVGFRRRADVAFVVGALLLGLLATGGALALLGVRIHFINFVALPITMGVGADYALNIMSRYRQAGGGVIGVTTALRGSGGPVVLCSLTTTLGYLALLRSRNQAVRSLGTIAVLGEINCLLAAVLVLPALLRWVADHRARGTRRPPAPASEARLQQSTTGVQM